jgi:hypothetical protein
MAKRAINEIAKWMCRTLWLCAFPIATLYGQNPKTGPAVGQAIPDFSAHDQDGRSQTFKSITGPKGAMLVFFRSADW